VSNFNPSDENNKDGMVNKVLRILDNENKQEKSAFEDKNSLIIGKDAELFRKREEEYRDPEKHWIRKEVWLKTAELIQKKKQKKGNNKGIRYLTLPAYHRLDVSLFIKKELLEVTKKNSNGAPEEIYVAAFENNPDKFALMKDQSPKFKLFGLGDIEKVLTDPTNEYYEELRSLFPFDIINIDLTSSLTPQHEGPYSKTMEAIESIFDIQSGFGIDWALFLTFRNVPADLETNARKQLFDNLQNNIKRYPEVLVAFQNRYNLNSVQDLEKKNVKTCISQSIAKWLVDRAHQHKYKVESIKPYFYTRYNEGIEPYKIYKHVLELTPGNINVANIPTKDTPEQTWMKSGLIRCVEQHQCTDVEEKLMKLLDNAPDKFEEINEEIESLCKMV
jgi:hypothetical protein